MAGFKKGQKKEQPRIIKDQTDLDTSDITGRLVDIKNRIEKFIEKYGENAFLEIDTCQNYGVIETGVILEYERLETLAEQKKRVKAREAAKRKKERDKIRKEKHELEIYEKLKKKYDKDE